MLRKNSPFAENVDQNKEQEDHNHYYKEPPQLRKARVYEEDIHHIAIPLQYNVRNSKISLEEICDD